MTNYTKEQLEKYILEDNLSYEAIGKMYGLTGAAIRMAAKRFGIILPKRRRVNPSETFNKGTRRNIKHCKNCGQELDGYCQKIYCSNKCQMEFEHKEFISRWKSGEENGTTGTSGISTHIRRYLFNKHNSSCEKCLWNEINPITQLCPLEIHHIDGNCLNNSEDNLQLLCPNCHSLTSNYGSLNSNSSR